MVGNKELVDLIVKKHGTRAAFARRIGWSPQRLHEFLKAHESASKDPVRDVIDALGLDHQTAQRIFYE